MYCMCMYVLLHKQIVTRKETNKRKTFHYIGTHTEFHFQWPFFNSDYFYLKLVFDRFCYFLNHHLSSPIDIIYCVVYMYIHTT